MPRRKALGRSSQDRAKTGNVLDRLIGGQDRHDLVVGAVDREGRKRDRRGRVPSERLEEKVRAGACSRTSAS